MIFPSGKPRNNEFNPLSDDAASYQTHSQRQNAENGNSAEQIKQAETARVQSKKAFNDGVKHTVSEQTVVPQNASLMDRLAAVLASKSGDTAMGRGASIGK